MPRAFADTGRYIVGLAGLGAVSLVVSAVLWAVIAPLAFGWSPIAVMSGSMEPAIDTGDMVFVAPSDGEDLAPGTVIVYTDGTATGRVTHRIVDVTTDGRYVTRGDASGRIDSTPVAPADVDGVGKMIVPGLAKPFVWVQHGEWLLLAAAIAGLAAAAYASRWALFARFDPWRSVSVVPPTPGVAIRRPSRVPIVVGIVLGLVVGIGFSTAHSRAAFGGATGNIGNSAATDTLDPPTAVVATSGTTISVDWTATPDTYAAGHIVYRSTVPGGPYTAVGAVAPRTVVHYEESPPPGTYYYVVRAFFASWESVDSNEATASTFVVDDYDAIPPGTDNCPNTFNVDQFDTDGDGIGDACDPSPTVPSSGVFVDTGQTIGSSNTLDVAAADFDGDGDIDVAFANDGPADTVWLNDGNGNFVSGGQVLGPPTALGIAAADLDGDGDRDLVFSTKGANEVWLNDGTASFTDSGQALGSKKSWSVRVGDFDGDGDLDLVFANTGPNTVWLNDGSGTFTDSGQSLGNGPSLDVAVGDLDGDGDLDLAFADKGSSNVWLNDGTGTFATSGPAMSSGADVASGDIDGDGDLDLAFGAKNSSSIWVNDGAGVFTDSGQAVAGDVRGLAFGDTDGDGDIDLVTATKQAGSLLLNDGGGTFTDSGQALDPADSDDIVVVDVDGDGDLDLVHANAGANTVWFNT